MGIVEAGYKVRLPEQDWLQGISDAGQILGRVGVYSFTYDASDPARLRVSPTAGSGAYRHKSDELLEVAKAGAPLVPSVTKALYWGRWEVAFAEELVRGRAPNILEVAFAIAGASGAYSVRGRDSLHRGMMLTVPVRDGVRLPARTRGTLSRVAAHLGEAFRLRQRPAVRLEDSSAIFDERGRLEHISERLRGTRAVPMVQQHIDQLVEARKLRRESPEAAIKLWSGLVAGRWSIFDSVDSDGRRYLIARENAPDVVDPRALRTEEQRVLLYVARGHSLKLIAYELGLSPSTVSYCLKQSLRKLGLRSKSELVGLLGDGFVCSEPTHGDRPSPAKCSLHARPAWRRHA